MGKVIQGNFGKQNSDSKQKILVTRRYKASGFIGEHIGPCPHCGADMVLVEFRHEGKMGLCFCESRNLQCLHKALVPLIDRDTPEGLQEAKDLMQERLELNDEEWAHFTRGLLQQDQERKARRRAR